MGIRREKWDPEMPCVNGGSVCGGGGSSLVHSAPNRSFPAGRHGQHAPDRAVLFVFTKAARGVHARTTKNVSPSRELFPSGMLAILSRFFFFFTYRVCLRRKGVSLPYSSPREFPSPVRGQHVVKNQ